MIKYTWYEAGDVFNETIGTIPIEGLIKTAQIIYIENNPPTRKYIMEPINISVNYKQVMKNSGWKESGKGEVYYNKDCTECTVIIY